MSTDELNDRFQQAASPAEGLAILTAASIRAIRVLGDLNYVTEGDILAGLMADRFGEDWATQIEPAATADQVPAPYYARTFSAVTRHIIKPGDGSRTLCGHAVMLRDEFVDDEGKLTRPAPWMILDLPPCGKCARSEAARGLVPPVRTVSA